MRLIAEFLKHGLLNILHLLGAHVLKPDIDLALDLIQTLRDTADDWRYIIRFPS